MNHKELNGMVLQKLDGFYQLHYDKLAMEELKKEVDAKYRRFNSIRERIVWLVANDYYYPELLHEYNISQIKQMHAIAESYNFEHKSYMSMSKFYKNYALRTDDRKEYLEHYEDKNVIASLFYAKGDFERAKRYLHSLMAQDVQPATPSYMNAGRARRGELISCYLLHAEDSLNSINYVLNSCMQLSKVGGGVSVNLTDLRSSGDPIKGVEGAAKGLMPVAKLMEDAFSYADQMGQRKGSGAAYASIFHPDTPDLINSKKFNADEKIRLKTLSVGVIIPRKFFELMDKGEDFVRFSPYDIKKEYGVPMSKFNFDELYEDALNNPNVRKSKPESARKFMNDLSRVQIESGYPYIMFQTNANKFHPLAALGDVSFSNLCTEIFQLSEASEINDYFEEDQIKRDINCVLSSLNMYNIMMHKSIQEAVYNAMDLLTDVILRSNNTTVPSVKKANDEMHSTGLGVMNFHGYLASVGIPYESDRALEVISVFTMLMNYHSLVRSMEIAVEKGETFKGFEQSSYADGSYFDHYLENDYRPTDVTVQKLFEGMKLPGPADWAALKPQVMKNGLWHAYRLAIAPTQSISYIQNATQSIMPITDQVETRTYGDAKTCYPMPFLSPRTNFLYKSAYHMDPYNVIDVVAAAQVHIDQGISCILFVDSNMETAEIANLYMYAEMKGLKSLYYTRSRDLQKEDCESCAV